MLISCHERIIAVKNRRCKEMGKIIGPAFRGRTNSRLSVVRKMMV
jgi:hypothetical protein